MRVALLFTFISISYATTCSQLKTMYSDLTCCANQNVDTCLRSIPLCSGTSNGKICIDTNNDAIIKGGSSSYTLPTASTTELGGVKVDGSSIIIANGIISAPIGSSSSSTFSGDYNDLTNKPTIPTAFSGDYNDLTNKPTIPTPFSGDYNDLTNKPTIITSYNDLSDKPTIPTAFSGDYNDLTNKPDLSNVGGSSSGGVQKNGQLLDIVAGVADGRTVKGAEGDYTLEDVIAQQHITNDYPGPYDDVTGSKITYKPPAGSTEVIYKFRYYMKYEADTSSYEGQSVKLYIGGVQCGADKQTDNHAYGDTWVEFEWIIQIGTDDMPNGKISSWTDFKEIKVGMIERDSTAHNAILHGSFYSQNYGGSTTDVIQPELEVRAIGPGGAGGGVAVDNSTIKQHSNGTIYVANAPSGSSTAVVTRDGQVLEELVGVCDGGTVGSYTWPIVTAVQATTTTYTTLSGSEIVYTPPTGATEIIYSLTIAASTSATSGVFHVRMMVDGVESGASPTIGGAESRQYGTLETIRFVLDAWTGSKTLKLEVRHHSTGTTFQMNIHKRALTPAGATDATNELIKPILNIRAIGVQLNYINFDPTPTALLSAQTFEVTSEECASTALVNSIKAQFAEKFPQYTYGSGLNSLTSTALPAGCQVYVHTTQQAGTRILYNTDTTDPDNPLGSGYSTDSISYRICKYANGDFVLLTDHAQKCKTVHYTLPDNLGALAGVLQTSSTNMGIGISPTAPLHVGTGVDTNITVSRFECDGTGAIIEQTTGKVETIMSRDDCLKLPNFELGVVLPAVTATKFSDAVCSSGLAYKPYAFHVIEVTSGTPDESMTENECRVYSDRKGYTWYGQLSSSSNPKGCMLQYTTVYFNTVGGSCSVNSNSKCLQKLNVKLVESGTNTGSEALSEGECMGWGALTGRWNRHLAISSLPPGCMQNGPGLGEPYDHNDASIYWNSGSGSCSDSRYCVMRDTSLDNPGTPNDQHRVNACRDRCSQPGSKIWNGLTYGLLPYHTTPPFTPASFSIEPTGGECTCHSEPAATCGTTASNEIDFYALNWRPKGCFKDSNSVPGTTYHYWTDTEGGVCSDYYPCLRSDDACLAKDTTPEVKKLSMIVEKSAWFKEEVVISSDRRIKENIVEVEGARERMRQISAKNYSYVDKRKYNGTTVGFIAQEVAQVMPEAVKVERGFVPNLLKRVKCTFARNITLNMTCNELNSGRVRLFVTDENGENLLDIDVKNGVMEVEKVYTQVYAFGYEVDDFHTLEKSKLFALNFAATKELDKEVQLLRAQMNQLLSQR